VAKSVICLAIGGVIATLAYTGDLVAQQLRGRVVDEPQRQGMADSPVRLLAEDSTQLATTRTDDAGFFWFNDVRDGSYYVVVEVPGFRSASKRVTVDDGNDLVIPAFVLTTPVVVLDTVVAQSDIQTSDVPVGFGRTSHVLAGEAMAVLERHGVSVYSAVKELGGSLRVRPIRKGGRNLNCIESTRRIMSMSSANVCEMVAVVVDGILIGDPIFFVRDVRLNDYESIEYVAPVEAGYLYGLESIESEMTLQNIPSFSRISSAVLVHTNGFGSSLLLSK